MIIDTLTSSNSDIIDLTELKSLDRESLEKIAVKHKIDSPTSYLRQDLILAILQNQSQIGGVIYSTGVLEILPDNFGFLRSPDYNYMPGSDDIYVFSITN